MTVALKTDQPARHPNPTAKAQRLSHLVFTRPDLDVAEKFFIDFGLVTAERHENRIYMRAAEQAAYCLEIIQGPEAALIGIGLEVRGEDDMAALAALPGATRGPAHGPGGGECVLLEDPAGRRVEAVYGQNPYDPIPLRAPLGANSPGQVDRVNEGQRPPIETPQINKLGHLVIQTAGFQAMAGFYTEHFGLIPSDIEVLPDGSPMICFFRLDKGDEPADHHTIAMAQTFEDSHVHTAFELVDQDAVAIGQKMMREKGYNHAWGIGRHILGSQIFDYWRDPYGEMFEHYSDGDVFTPDIPAGVHAAGGDTLYQWGPKLPADFMRPKMSPKTIKTLITNLRKSPDLSIKKLKLMVKSLG